MCDGGRVRHHLKNNLWRPESTVLLVGFQATGTLGQVLLSGSKAVRIHGEEVAVRAAIRSIDVYSGHADRGGLIAWAQARQGAAGSQPPHIFLTHGEPQALAALRQGLLDARIATAGIDIPAMDETIELTGELAGAKLRRLAAKRPRLAPETAARPDWHNRYAALLLRLAERLRASKSDAARDKLLERLKQDLE